MKIIKTNIIIVVLLFIGTAFSVVSAQEKIKKVKQHPYLYFTDERIKVTKERIKKDTLMQASWEKMLKNADDVVAKNRGGSIEELSLVYRMTGDKKYAEQVKRHINEQLKREYWDQLDDRTPKWNSALGTGTRNGQVAGAFDAIYDMLTPAERKEIAQGIVRLGIEPSIGDWTSTDKRLHTINTMGHNWWSAIVFQAGVASLAIMNEVPEAKGWAEDLMEAAGEWFAFNGSVLENKPSNFDPKGGFYESLGYANYGIGEYLFFRLAWTNAVNPIKCDYDQLLKNTMNWFIQMSYPNNEQLMSMNFGDGNIKSHGERPVKLMMALGFDEDNYHWYVNLTSRAGTKEDLSVRTPLGLVYNPVLRNVKAPNLPLSAMYDNMGWASLRSSWDENATLFGIKSGFTWNHAHADASSFILFHNGKNLLIDGGNVNYGNPLYSSYSVRSEAHNVVLFNGKAQEPQDQFYAVKNQGKLYHLMDGGNYFRYILADATGPTAHYFLRNYRNVVWVGDVILIFDDVKAYEDGKFEWLLHTAVDAQKKGIDMEVTDSTASVLVRPLFPETLPNGYPHDFPEKMRYDIRQGVKDHDPKTMVNYYSFYADQQAKQTKFVTAIMLLDDKNKPIEGAGWRGMSSAREMRHGLPKIERLQGNDMIGVRITQDGMVTDVYMNIMADGRIMHRNSHNVINAWETDAYMFGFTYKEGQEDTKFNNLFVANGSYLRKGGKSVISTLAKVFMTMESKNGVADVVLQGQPVTKLHLLPAIATRKLKVNGEAKTFEKGKYGEMIIRVK